MSAANCRATGSPCTSAVCSATVLRIIITIS
jgi:hypothetical protein